MLASLVGRRAARNLRCLSTAYTYSAPGEPSAILSRQSLQPPSPPQANNIQVTWLAAGIDPVDLATLSGAPSANTYNPPSLPAVPGNEGVASVTAVGPKVSGISEGDLVIPIKPAVGTWCESATLSAADVIPIPPMRLELAATLSASPFTAIRLLSDFATLSPGDVVLQNAGAGPVATAVVQIASALGLRTVSLVKTAATDYAPTVERLKLLGGDVAVGEEFVDLPGFRHVLADLPKPKLVLNGSDQASCALLAPLAGADATVVTYCPGVPDVAALKASGLASDVFSLANWLEKSSRTDVEKMVSTLAGLIQEGRLTAWLQRVAFEELPTALREGGATERKLVAVMQSSASS